MIFGLVGRKLLLAGHLHKKGEVCTERYSEKNKYIGCPKEIKGFSGLVGFRDVNLDLIDG